MRPPAGRRLTLAVVLLVVVGLPLLPLRAQSTYGCCALGIAPVWNGLAVVQGPERTEVANLQFFWPRRVDATFAGDSARSYAVRAFQTRRIAAVLTDVGGLLLVTTAIRGLRAGRLGGAERAMAIAGAGAFALSVPLHFSADGSLSRAIWWHNSGYAR